MEKALKIRGRPKKYQTEEERIEKYREVHKNSCKNYWKETFKMAQMNESDKFLIVTEQQLEELITNIVAEKLKNIFST